jgi:hypothetical protein
VRDEVPCPICRFGLTETAEAIGKVILCPECMANLLVQKRDQLCVVSKKIAPDPEDSVKRLFDYHSQHLKYGQLYVFGMIALAAVGMAAIMFLVHVVTKK